jgi:hypothetical protein
MPTTRDDALELARNYAATHWSDQYQPSRWSETAPGSGGRLEAGRPAVHDWDYLHRAGRAPRLYGVSLVKCWVVYLARSQPWIGSSQIIALAKDTGEVVYAGSANDEG